MSGFGHALSHTSITDRVGRQPLNPMQLQARKVLGAKLRRLRAEANLTGTQLAERLGFSISKLSRIETGQLTPRASEILDWCGACGKPEDAKGFIAELHSIPELYREFREMATEGGLATIQRDKLGLYRRTRMFRVYSPALVPGALQTREYAEAILAVVSAERETPNDSRAAASARLARSRIIRQRRMVAVVEEAVLLYRVGSTDVTRSQLLALKEDSRRSWCSLAIIPHTSTRYTQCGPPTEGFWLFDRRTARTETVHASITLIHQHDVMLYERIFEGFLSAAVTGAAAHDLIDDAISALDSQ